MADYIHAMKRPFSDLKRLIIGILLSIPVPLLRFLTETIALGYAYQCGKTAYEGETELPKWEKFMKLWVMGFLAAVIALIYSIPVLIAILTLARDLLKDYMFVGTETTVAALQNFGHFVRSYGPGIFVVWGLALILSYIIPIAIMKFVIDGKFGSAFHLRFIFSKIFTLRYLKAWLVVTVLTSATSWLTLKLVSADALKDLTAANVGQVLVSLAPFLAVSIIITFVMNVFAYTVYGSIYKELE
ncbi:MAG: DUF4013 domain-containing protein [Nanoarchaeota archaeon]|nr:DUF4013 domain-containing protein [Nanoarchaeota archaeon]